MSKQASNAYFGCPCLVASVFTFAPVSLKHTNTGVRAERVTVTELSHQTYERAGF